MKGKRKGPKLQAPRFKMRRGRGAIGWDHDKPNRTSRTCSSIFSRLAAPDWRARIPLELMPAAYGCRPSDYIKPRWQGIGVRL